MEDDDDGSSYWEGESGETDTDFGECDVDGQSFGELELHPEIVKATRDAWSTYCLKAESEEAAGEQLYSAIFEGVPSVQVLFSGPRAIQAMRLLESLGNLVAKLSQPKELKAAVEVLSFAHLNLDISASKVTSFRNAILDLLEVEVDQEFTKQAKSGWVALLNYVGGAILHVKAFYVERLQLLTSSWAKANKHVEHRSKTGDQLEAESPVKATPKATKKGLLGVREAESAKDEEEHIIVQDFSNLHNLQRVPTTFKEMFEFNAAIMNLTKHRWMWEVLTCFEPIVENVSNSSRLQEECGILILRIAKVAPGTLTISEFKNCMLASLRSLLPKDWDSSYEEAWNWFWAILERIVAGGLGKPERWGRVLSKHMADMSDEQAASIRKEIYTNFFDAAPAGQEYFKQSDTRLNYIADRIMHMSVDLFEEPARFVDDISGLGLRHVGYGVPTDLFGPFVTSCIEAMLPYAKDREVMEAFSWSLGLITKMLTRTINEGSTIVMKAINANSTRQLAKAISSAPRGQRARWLLDVSVGAHTISPLQWAMESGSFDAARAILEDLLTIRADRERYYYGMEDLFGRHPDIIKTLSVVGQELLPTLLDGLVWRSHRATQDSMRRVNYYVKYLFIDKEGGASLALEWLVEFQDPKTMVHPAVVAVSDRLWQGVVKRHFVLSKIWFVLSLLVFMLSQAILPNWGRHSEHPVRVVIFAGRMLTYSVTMLRLLATHVAGFVVAVRSRKLSRVCWLAFPSYLQDWTEAAHLLLAIFLLLMCTHEPMLWCAPEAVEDGIFPTAECGREEPVLYRYSVFGMIAMVIHWVLIMDMSVFNTGLSAFMLVCVQVLSELTRWLVAMGFLLLMFGCAISVLEHDYYEMRDIPTTAVALFAITVRLYEDDYRDLMHDPALLVAVLAFITVSTVLLLNLLIAQLNCSYEYVYKDINGFARLKRAECIVDCLSSCPENKWRAFVSSLELDKNLEFNEGDVGLPGGVQELEPASLHHVLEDSICRFGGSTSVDMRWPEVTAQETDENRYERLEKLIHKTMKRLAQYQHKLESGRGSGALDDLGQSSGMTSSADSSTK